MIPLFHVFLLMFCLIFSCSIQAGVVVAGTRFVFEEGKESLSISLRNTSREPYLVQVKVRPVGESENSTVESTAFIATPPVFLLSGGRENKIRVIPLSEDKSRGREQLFWLSVSAIPAGEINHNVVQVAVRSNYKLFYRPTGLNGSANDAYKALVWERTGNNGIMVKNITPYYITFLDVKVNNVSNNDIDMLPPFSQQTVSWCHGVSRCQITWKTLDDFGGILPEYSVMLSNE
jgi:P pilus assembly chaperone PapD